VDAGAFDDAACPCGIEHSIRGTDAVSEEKRYIAVEHKKLRVRSGCDDARVGNEVWIRAWCRDWR
jgi:hypothetical protein